MANPSCCRPAAAIISPIASSKPRKDTRRRLDDPIPFGFSLRARIIPRMESAGKLIIVPTPIGNLGDITLRAVEALRASDAVLCEDTRVTGKLLAHLGIEKPLVRLDENTIRERARAVLERIQAGEQLAYCSDAGMPGVSDPGMALVRAARAEGLATEVLPGASAATTAYVASGFSTTRFLFAGFLSKKASERQEALAAMRAVDAALIFYESPHRLASALETIADAFPHREVAVCRELTKLHEEVVSGPSGEVARMFQERAAHTPIKGEIAIVVDGPSDAEADEAKDASLVEAHERAAELAAQGARPKEIAKQLVASCGIPRNAAYDIALAARDEGTRHA